MILKIKKREKVKPPVSTLHDSLWPTV